MRNLSEYFKQNESLTLNLNQRALGITTGAEGGFLTDKLLGGIEKILKDFGGVAETYRTINTNNGNVLKIPVCNDTANRSTYINQNTQFTGTDPSFQSINLYAHKYYSEVIVPNELLEDADMTGFIGEMLGERMARGINYAAINSVVAPTGILVASGTSSVSRNTANQFKFVDAATMVKTPDTAYFKNAKWMMNSQVLTQLVQLADSSGRIIWIPNAPITLFGFEVVINNDLPALGTKGDVIFGDWSQAILRTVNQVVIKASPELNGHNDQTTFMVTHRWDVGYLNTAAFVLLN